MERSAAYAGILGAILFALSGILPGPLPATDAGAGDIATYVASSHGLLELGGWLFLPAVALILWFVYGAFESMRDAEAGEGPLVRWGSAGAITFVALGLASSALEASMGLQSVISGDELPVIYDFSVVLFTFGMGGFAMMIFSIVKLAGRKGALPGWINAFGYVVVLIDALYTLSVMVPSGPFSPASISAIFAGLFSSLWILVASIVLLVKIRKAAS